MEGAGRQAWGPTHAGDRTWPAFGWEGAGRQDSREALPETQLWHLLLGRSPPSPARVCPSAVRRKAGLEVRKDPHPFQLTGDSAPVVPHSSAPPGRQPEPLLPGLSESAREHRAQQPVWASLGLTARRAEADELGRSPSSACPQEALDRQGGKGLQRPPPTLLPPEGSPRPRPCEACRVGRAQSRWTVSPRPQCRSLAAPHPASGWPRPQPGHGTADTV